MASELAADLTEENWQRFPIRRIEDLRNAVLGADLEATQMTGSCLRGSLAFCASRGVVFSSGLIEGKVAVRGALANDAVTVFLCLRLGSGSRLWLNAAHDGDVGVVLPGEKHDAIHAGRSIYLAATLTEDRLRNAGKRGGMCFDRGLLRETGVHPKPIPPEDLAETTRQVALIHNPDSDAARSGLGSAVLRRIINHCARHPPQGEEPRPRGRARIVHRAREYIHKHLAAPIGMSDLAEATDASTRTLHRAFAEVLEDTPQSYIRRLRLHRIRRELISREGATGTIAAAVMRWGAGSDLGRLSARYRALFGENPSATLAYGRARASENELL